MSCFGKDADHVQKTVSTRVSRLCTGPNQAGALHKEPGHTGSSAKGCYGHGVPLTCAKPVILDHSMMIWRSGKWYAVLCNGYWSVWNMGYFVGSWNYLMMFDVCILCLAFYQLLPKQSAGLNKEKDQQKQQAECLCCFSQRIGFDRKIEKRKPD